VGESEAMIYDESELRELLARFGLDQPPVEEPEPEDDGEAPEPAIQHEILEFTEREPIEPKPIKAWLLNIGGGGVGVTVEHGHALGPSLRRTTRFLASVKLPGEDQPLHVVAKLVHLQAMHGDTLYLGFEFQFDHTAEQRRVEDQIVRVTTLLQRQQIRRQRGA